LLQMKRARKKRTIFFCLFYLTFVSLCYAKEPFYGKFIGTVKTEWLPDHRRMRLLASLAYIDPHNVRWDAPSGWVIDGASIPQCFWSIIGGPYEGNYRNASVIHDVACDQKRRPWEAVHEAFYYAMLCEGAEPVKAKIMYGAVYFLGPRWPNKIVKEVAISNVHDMIKRVRTESAVGSKIDIIEMKGRPLIYPNQSETIDIIVNITPPENQLSEADFAKLKAAIEEREHSKQGAMSLEEIRNYRPPD